jgi:TonB family protein
MTGFQRAMFGVGVIATALVGIALATGLFRDGSSSSLPTLVNSFSNDAPDKGYRASDDIIDPYELSKNPYQLKGHSGILDTLHVTLLGGNGQLMHTPYPGGGLRFGKMIDKHTATYQVLVGRESVYPDGEIAVILPDSNPPDSKRPWRVFVEGPLEAVNGLGNPLKISAVRFEGYYVAPPKPTPITPQAMPDTNRGADPADASGDGSERVMKVGGDVSAPIPISMPDPEFTEAARQAKLSGSVLVHLLVDQNGDPTDAQVMRGLGMGLDEQALEAVRHYKFRPAKKDGKPVVVEMNVEVQFQAF